MPLRRQGREALPSTSADVSSGVYPQPSPISSLFFALLRFTSKHVCEDCSDAMVSLRDPGLTGPSLDGASEHALVRSTRLALPLPHFSVSRPRGDESTRLISANVTVSALVCVSCARHAMTDLYEVGASERTILTHPSADLVRPPSPGVLCTVSPQGQAPSSPFPPLVLLPRVVACTRPGS